MESAAIPLAALILGGFSMLFTALAFRQKADESYVARLESRLEECERACGLKDQTIKEKEYQLNAERSRADWYENRFRAAQDKLTKLGESI